MLNDFFKFLLPRILNHSSAFQELNWNNKTPVEPDVKLLEDIRFIHFFSGAPSLLPIEQCELNLVQVEVTLGWQQATNCF